MITDNALNILLSWQFVLFSLTVFGIISLFRTVVEFAIPKVSNLTVWTTLILRILPPALGFTIAHFGSSLSYPDGISSTGARQMLGFTAGLFSSMVYAIVKEALQNKAQQFLSNTQQLEQNANTVIDAHVQPQIAVVSIPEQTPNPPTGAMGSDKR